MTIAPAFSEYQMLHADRSYVAPLQSNEPFQLDVVEISYSIHDGVSLPG
jgi:hypothetical protein